MLVAPSRWDYSRMKHFSRSHEMEILSLAVGLSDDEVYQYYGISDIEELPEYDKLFLRVTIDRARLTAKQSATNSMFQAMKGRDGLAASLAYLTRFGHQGWKSESGTGAKEPKTLTILLE